MKRDLKISSSLLFLALVLMLNGCSSSATNTSATTSSTSGVNLPLVTPPVKAATPVGLGGGSSSSSKAFLPSGIGDKSLSSSDFKTRFFTTGPTSLFGLLTTFDGLITTVNTLSQTSKSICLTQTPVPYTITPFGQSVTMYGQCYSRNTPSSASDPAFIQFGTNAGITYIYAASGAERIATIVTPIAGSTGQYIVQAWIGLGYLNTGTWDSMSYGVMQLVANSSTKAFEFTVAGIGFGYCGLQMISDGVNLSSQGSTDMGTTCNTADTLCVAASDGVTAGSCSGLSFTLPALGRRDVPAGTNAAANHSGASLYPTSPNITLTGTSGDALYFGPLTPTTGVAAL